jgi:hypothetical protein
MRLRDKLRLKWLMATKTLDYSAEATDRMYRVYLNHGKVIHYRKGHPVYSRRTSSRGSSTIEFTEKIRRIC